MLVDPEALLADTFAKGLAESPIGVLNDPIGSLDGDEAGHLLEELGKTLLALPKLLLELLDLVDVGVHLHHRDHLARGVADRGGVHHHRDLAPAAVVSSCSDG